MAEDVSHAQHDPLPFTHLASHELSTHPGGARQASGSVSSKVTHHLLPASISPTADLALVFSTTAPTPIASAGAAGGPGAPASAPNQSGLSAAQRLIQQRMAAMRARAAAAAGLPSSSNTDDLSTGPIKGQPIEMTLWRIGNEMELVWKQTIKIADAIFEGQEDTEKRTTVAKQREQETISVGGMQWSPNGRLIALQITVSRSTSSQSRGRMASLVNLYTVQEGNLSNVTLLQDVSQDMSRKCLRRMVWVQLDGATSLDRREVCGSSMYISKKYPGRPPVDLDPIIALAAAAPGSGGMGGAGHGGRFQSLMGGGAASKVELILPSRRGLESEHASKAGEGDKEDFLRGWNTLGPTSVSSTDTNMDVLLLSETDGEGEDGTWLLLRGRLPLAFLRLPKVEGFQRRLATCRIGQQRELLSVTLGIASTDREEGEVHLDLWHSAYPFLSSASGLTTLCHLLDVSSRLLNLSAQALDLSYLLSALFKTLKSASPIGSNSLSAQQATSLPCISRLHYALDQLAISHVQNMANHLITLLCTGIASEMIESMLLNTLVSGKWKSIYDETLKTYEAIEVTASEVGRVVEEIGSCVAELQGWSEWTERVRPFLPASIDEVPLSSHLQAHQSSVSTSRSTAHKIIHYAQGERLAWDEMNKWVTWERERIEALNTESEDQPYTARTFDPLVVIELVQRDFECPELHWLLLGAKTKVKGEIVDNDKVDESEESFVRPGGPEESVAQVDKSNLEDMKDKLDLESRRAVQQVGLSGPSLATRLSDTMRWLSGGDSDHGEQNDSASLKSNSGHTAFDDEPPRLFQGEIVPTFQTSMYADVPLGPRLCHLIKGLKAIFIDLPHRLRGLQDTKQVISLPLPQSWVGRPVQEDVGDDDEIISHPSQTQSVADLSGGGTFEQRRSNHLLTTLTHSTKAIEYVDTSTGDTVHQVILGNVDKNSLILLRVFSSGKGSFVELSHGFESFDFIGHNKLLVVSCQLTEPKEHRVDCLDLDNLFDVIGMPLEQWEGSLSYSRSTTSGSAIGRSAVPSSALLLRQVLPPPNGSGGAVSGEEDDENYNGSIYRELAVSSGRNMAALLSRHRLLPTKGSSGSVASEVTHRQKREWSRQVIDFWDLVGDEGEGEDGKEEAVEGDDHMMGQ